MSSWRWRGSVALLAVGLAFVIYPLLPSFDVINSDWPAFETGARVIVSNPGHLYDLAVQQRVELDVTGGRALVTLGVHGILPFLAPAWVALLAVPFDLLGPNLGGHAWVLFGLVCLLAGLFFAIRPRPPSEVLAAFAGVPTALMMLNAQLDGIVALGIGAAVAMWSQPYLAGLALGLTLMKPHLVLPIGFGLLLTRRWKVLAGWASVSALFVATTLLLNPHWISEWIGQTGSTVQAGGREIDLPHLAVFFSSSVRTYALATLALIAISGVLGLAARCRGDLAPAAAILVIGGVVASPHALPADLVLVAVGLAIWGKAEWFEWLALSAVALATALLPDPLPLGLGVALMGWLTLRISLSTRRGLERASAR